MSDGLNPVDSNILSTDSLSGSISFTGLGSGTDFAEIVDQLVEIESIQKTRLETWRSTWEAKVEVIEALTERLDSIEEGAAAMDTESEFLVRAAGTSNSSIVTAQASSSAAVGSYSVEVGSSIKHIMQSNGVADADTTAYHTSGSSGVMVLNIDGVDYEVTIDANATLNTICDNINDSGAPVTALVVNDGTENNPYHLELISDVGGKDGRITVTQNPTDLNLNLNGVVLQDDSSWTGTSAMSVVGQFTGDMAATASSDVWTYTISNATGSDQTVGDGSSFELTYVAADKDGTIINSGTITVPDDYTEGDSITLENGLSIQLEAGTIIDGDSITYRAYANGIDQPELSDWEDQPTVTVSGNYLGSVSKTYSLTVVTGATIADGGGAGTAVLRWTDSTGATGTVSISDSSTAYEIEAGVKISIDEGYLTAGKDFQINVFAPDKQQGQNDGLAQVAKVVHEGFADDTSTAVTTTSGTFTYVYGGEEISVSVASGATLSQLANLINSDSNNPGVRATIINDGQGLPTSYRLVLTGQSTGATNQITSVSHDFTGSSFSSSGDMGGGFSTSQVATNSMVKIDGFPAEEDEYLQRSTNTVADVIEGVSLSLYGSGTSQVTVAYDTSSIIANIEAFINAVNYAQDYIRLQTQYDDTGEDTGLLIGNYGFYTLKTRIDSILYSSVAGLDSDTDTYTLLGQIGIESDPDNDGTWTIDSSALSEALAADPEAVANLFIYNSSKGTSGVARLMYEEMEVQTDEDTGMGPILVSNYQDIISNINKKIEDEEIRIELYQERMTERFARLEATLTELNAQQTAIESQLSELQGD